MSSNLLSFKNRGHSVLVQSFGLGAGSPLANPLPNRAGMLYKLFPRVKKRLLPFFYPGLIIFDPDGVIFWKRGMKCPPDISLSAHIFKSPCLGDEKLLEFIMTLKKSLKSHTRIVNPRNPHSIIKNRSSSLPGICRSRGRFVGAQGHLEISRQQPGFRTPPLNQRISPAS
jgi:hypothetical protein